MYNEAFGGDLNSVSDEKVCSEVWTVEPDNKERPETHESRLSFIIQTFFPFLLAGLGLVAAGLLLERASNWYFLKTVQEALIMVPALLGLKGNLEMTLASRLSTLANLGKIDTRREQLDVLISNTALVQIQAIVVSFSASIFTYSTIIVEGHPFILKHFVSLSLTAILTASVASFILSTIMVTLAIICRKCKIDPDNICTPIAAMLGDVTTLIFLISFGTLLTYNRNTMFVAQSIALVLLLCSTIIWIKIASKNQITYEVLKNGWYIIFIAMMISSAGGYVLKCAINKFQSLASFQPIINGAGGNLVAVQASKISTYLHRFGKPGVLPANSLFTYLNPFRTFTLKEEESFRAWLLLIMSIPGHSIFLTVIFMIQFGVFYSSHFYCCYVIAGLIQVAILLYICQISCRFMWQFKINPDNNAIPLLTSLGDLLGTSLLTIVFFFLKTVFPASLPSYSDDEP